MEISYRDAVTLVHGMGFGALFMLAFAGVIGIVGAAMAAGPGWAPTARSRTLFRACLIIMAAMAWLTVLSGTYLIYPWYRARPPAGADLSAYPRALLLSSPRTAGWHELGMEWKEHVAWFAPMAVTMAAALLMRYGPQLAGRRELRSGVLAFTAAAFLATSVAGVFGAQLNKYAPVRGGAEIVLLREK
jgi:hypothetical protein